MISPAYVHEFPLIPGGGLFFIPIGLCIILGAVVPRARMMLVWIGLAFGVLAIVFGGQYMRGLPSPSILQIASFAAAIAVEAVAFRIIIPRQRSLGERPMLLATLAIVGAHFLIMVPAFGLPILILALLCLGNAAAVWLLPSYAVSTAWFVDGVFKAGVGAAMLLASPALAGVSN